MKKEVGKNIKFFDPIFHPLNPGNTVDLKAASNPHNDTTSSEYFGLTNSSTLTDVGKVCFI